MQDKIPQIRILDYMHISSKTLNSDSNFYVHLAIFKYVQKHYPDKFAFHTTYNETPENNHIMNNLHNKHPFVHPVPINYHTTNAFFRNALDWEGLSKHARDYDLIWNNTPEVSFELLSYGMSKGMYGPIISYSHWLPSLVSEIIIANYLKDSPEKNCLFVKYFYNYFICQANYNNSAWGTKLINDSFSILPSQEFVQQVRDTVCPLYLTVDHEEIDRIAPINDGNKFDVPVIVFNHRHNAYTGFSFTMQALKKIIDMRPDLKFKILLTSVGEIDKTYQFNIPEEYFISKDTLPYDEYIKLLWKADIQLGTHDGSNQWSLSFIDGMFANCIPLYRRGHFFDEMFNEIPDTEELQKYSFVTENEFIEKLVFMLCNIQHFRDNNQNIFNHFRKHWTWDKLIHAWVDAFVKAYKSGRYVTTEKLDSVDTKSLPMTWREIRKVMNISDQRATNVYRKSFKQQHNIKEDMTNPDVVFYREEQPIRKTRGLF